jgi:YVTN family beta-propeller protein
MRTRWMIVVALAATTGLVACDDGGEADAGMDDAGDEDAGMMVDPCDLCDPETQMCVDSVCVDNPPCGGPCDPGEVCNEDTDMCVPDVSCSPECVAPEVCEMGSCVGPLPRPSRSTTIDVNADNTRVAMVNPDADSITVFNTTDDSVVAETDVGDAPSSLVWHPNGTTLFVANQGDATVVRIDNADTATPTVGTPVNVGSEPTGLALSPFGTQLFVAEWAESRVSVISTATMTPLSSFNVASPYAIAVTNDNDIDESDESVIVPEFFGRVVANGETSNTGRTGFVQIRPMTALDTEAGVSLAPIASGFPNDAMSDMTVANQLFGVTIHDGRAYITSISASPERPNGPQRAVHSVLYVVNIATRTVDTARTQSLSRLVRMNLTTGARNFLADIVALDFVNNFAYIVSRGGDAVQRLDYTAEPGVMGPPFGAVDGVRQIELNSVPPGDAARCQMPTGIVSTIGAGIGGTTRRVWVSCEATRQLGGIALSTQTLDSTTESAEITASETRIMAGKRFFFTGRGRWSGVIPPGSPSPPPFNFNDTAVSSCGSCHPGGLSDNITWRFGFGPRQTTSLDGSYSHPNDGSAVEQRVFNWTANFDEMHDFERNTRDTSGGIGAITSSSAGACGTLAMEQRDPAADNTGLPLPVAGPMRAFARDAGSCTPDEWDEIDEWARTIRPPRGRRGLNAAAVAAGRTLFEQGCAHCHGGQGWTVSERFWTPEATLNMNLLTADLAQLPAPFQSLRTYTDHIQPQPAGSDPLFDSVMANITPPHVGCAIRQVQTFGVRNPDNTFDTVATDLLEMRAVATVRALGAAGFNVPSLYGMQLGAPFLHHGQAATLEELFTLDKDPTINTRWEAHMRGVNSDPAFLTTQTQVDNLIAFILSIDASTPIVPLDGAAGRPAAGFDICIMP